MPGLYVHRASRLEALAETLAGQLAAQPAASVLTPQTVVVAHPGMKRWLQQQLAQRPAAGGAAGIAANFAFLLPGEWWLRLGDAMLGAADARPWQYAVLRWRIHALLGGRIDDARLRRFVDVAPPRRRWQLAEHLARLLGEYQVYRADWLQRWAAGDAVLEGARWQAALWRALLDGTPAAPRALRERALLETLLHAGAPARDAEPVHMFGIAHLPPRLLQGLQALSRARDVHLYFPDPCRELWDDLRSARAQLHADGDGADAHYEVGHPLLASLGRMGQAFTLILNSDDAAQESRDAQDESDAPTQALPLLARVQESIRRLQPDCAARPVDASARGDASLRVHACHGRLRELEVLRDALLGLRVAYPDLEPRQIVVMAPRIQDYAPLLPAVFGAPGHWHDAALPYHLADVPLAATHPLFAAWRQLLGLAQSRCTLSEVLGLLDVPALARRFGLDGAARQRVAGWLRAAHVAWALDAGMKPAFGAPAEDLHTFAFGLDRLMAGWLIGDAAPAAVLRVPAGAAQPIVPLAEVSGSDFEQLAGLARLLDELGAWRAAAGTARSGAEWSPWLARRIDACFAGSPGDDAADSRDEQRALAQLRQLAARPAVETRLAGLDDALPWEIIVAQQRAALDEIPSRQPYVAAGITFCGMVPQRTIPHRVVAILGLNEGEYPRASSPSSLDLIARHPRRGDRSALEEDRYLFLEALMAARDALHLSYVAEDASDGGVRNPAAPLAELLAFLDEAHGRTGDIEPPWLLRHALQPFAAVYFEQPRPGEDWHPDPALRSFAQAYAAAAGAGDARGGARPVLPLDALPAAPAGDAGAVRDLAALRAFLRKPAQAQARALLGVRLPEEEDEDADDEPLAARPAPMLRLPARVFEQALAQGMAELPMRAPTWLARSGQLPAGAAGEETWRELRASVQAALALLADHPCRHARREERACRFEDAAGHVLQGSVPVLRDAAGHDWLLCVQTRKELDFSVRLPLWLEWAACVLDPAAGPVGGCLLLHLHGDSAELIDTRTLATRDTALLRKGVARLLALHDAAQAGSAWYFPATTWAVACAKPEQRRTRARAVWSGGNQHDGERDRSPGYAALLTRGREWIDDDAQWQAFEELALALRELVGVDAEAGT